MKGQPASILLQTLDELRDALESVGAPYAVMGSVAGSYWGLPDPSCELEVAIGLPAENDALLARSAELALTDLIGDLK